MTTSTKTLMTYPTTNFMEYLRGLKGAALVELHNEMVLTAIDLGLDAKPTKRFADTRAGVERVGKLHVAIRAKMDSAPRKVDLYDAKNQLTHKDLALEEAAAKMGVAPDELSGFISRDGYCLVDNPEVLTAVWAGTPFINNTSTPAADAPAETTSEATATEDTTVEAQTSQTEENDDMARKAKAKKAKKATATRKASGPRNTSGPTLKELTDQYNKLVPAGKKAGVKCFIHTSLFESKEKAKKQIAKLEKQIKDAK